MSNKDEKGLLWVKQHELKWFANEKKTLTKNQNGNQEMIITTKNYL